MGDQTDDFQEATTGRQIALVGVIALAAALACLPAVVGIAAPLGITAPLSVGLKLAGTCIICFKALSIAYGICCQAWSRQVESSSRATTLPFDRRLRVLPLDRVRMRSPIRRRHPPIIPMT